MTHLGDFFSSAHQQKLQHTSHPDTFHGPNDTNFPIRLVTDAKALEIACAKLAVHPELALDLEFDDMRNFYGRTVSLIQVFDGDTVYLIDAVELKNIDPLLRILEDEKVIKIFHSCWNDLMVLSEVYGCQVRNLLDTSVLYRLLGHSENSISLKNLIKTYLDLDLEKGEQSSNWINRPLTDSQILYAAKDVIYLHQVTQLLQKELENLGRWEWALEECKALEKIKYVPEKQPYLRLAMKNRIYSHLWPRFADVWYFRENLAKKMNRPPFQLFPNDILCELVRNPQRTLEKWESFRGIHPSLRKTSALEQLAQLTAAEMPMPEISWREQETRIRAFERSQPDTKAFLRDERKLVLKQLRKLISNQIGQHVTNLFLSEKLLPELADLGVEKYLKRWQTELIKQTCEQNNLDYSLICFSLYEPIPSL
jgi:ribonuclease D